MAEPFFPREDFTKSSKIHNARNLGLVDFSDLWLLYYSINYVKIDSPLQVDLLNTIQLVDLKNFDDKGQVQVKMQMQMQVQMQMQKLNLHLHLHLNLNFPTSLLA